QANDSGSAAGKRLDVCIERAEHAGAAMIRVDVDALDPPKVSVAPVAPFGREHQLADDLASSAGHEVSCTGWIAKGGSDPSANKFQRQFLSFGFFRHGYVKRDDGFRVGQCRVAYVESVRHGIARQKRCNRSLLEHHVFWDMSCMRSAPS